MIAALKDLPKNFSRPAFSAAIIDIEALGFSVTTYSTPGASIYGVVSGRSNARWWFIPLENRDLARAGMALFQPISKSARILKYIAACAVALRLHPFLARQRLYISGHAPILQIWKAAELRYAFFTGTESPHRKVAVQIMDGQGNLKGFAKITRNPLVSPLLLHEASIINQIRSLGLKTASVPAVLYIGSHSDATVLITDTLKTAKTVSTTDLTPAHLSFLEEIRWKTAAQQPLYSGEIAREFRARFEKSRTKFGERWSARLLEAISALEETSSVPIPACRSHGDFTPWNTFLTAGCLYVFDWEYSAKVNVVGYDLIHFIICEPRSKKQSMTQRMNSIFTKLQQPWIGIARQDMPMLLRIYTITQTFHRIERMNFQTGSELWDGSEEYADILDWISDQSTSI